MSADPSRESLGYLVVDVGRLLRRVFDRRIAHLGLNRTQWRALARLVRTEGVTQAALKLQQLGVISYSRGLIKVLDRPKLEKLSCECYSVVKKETELLLNYMPQRQVIKNADAIPTATLEAA